MSAIGIEYTHRNDDLIAESAIEGQRIQKLIQEKKKAAKKAKQRRQSGKKSPEPEWPPRRKHHKPPPSPRSKCVSIDSIQTRLLISPPRLRMRQRALIEQGLLQTAEELPKFAHEL